MTSKHDDKISVFIQNTPKSVFQINPSEHLDKNIIFSFQDILQAKLTIAISNAEGFGLE